MSISNDDKQITIWMGILQLMDSLKFARIKSLLIVMLYFWSQTTVIFSLFDAMAQQIGLSSSLFSTMYLLNAPFVFYRIPTIASVNLLPNVDLLFASCLLLTLLIIVFVILIIVATRRHLSATYGH